MSIFLGGKVKIGEFEVRRKSRGSCSLWLPTLARGLSFSFLFPVPLRCMKWMKWATWVEKENRRIRPSRGEGNERDFLLLIHKFQLVHNLFQILFVFLVILSCVSNQKTVTRKNKTQTQTKSPNFHNLNSLSYSPSSSNRKKKPKNHA